MKHDKKGQIMSQFGSLAIGVAALCITLVIAFLIMSTAKTTMSDDNTACDSGSWNGSVCCLPALDCDHAGNQTERNSLAWNTTQTMQNATQTIPGWVSIIIITAIGAVLIGMVSMFRR